MSPIAPFFEPGDPLNAGTPAQFPPTAEPAPHGQAERFDRARDSIASDPGSAGAPALHPFRVTRGATGNVRVRFGTVNGIIPTIGATALNASTPPELTVVNGSVYLDITVDVAGEVTAVAVANAGSTPSDTATHAYRSLALVTVSGGEVTAINQAVTHSLGHRRCGVSEHHVWGL